MNQIRKKMRWICFFSIGCILSILLLQSPMVFAQSQETGYKEGYWIGQMIGEVYGERDSSTGKRSNWKLAHDKEKKNIDEDYALESSSVAYRQRFYQGFEAGFKEGYQRVYSNNKKVNVVADDKQMGYEHGERLGALLGESDGIQDYLDKKTNDWKRNILNPGQIRKKYELTRDTSLYSTGFIQGFSEAYKNYYTLAYRETKVEGFILPFAEAFGHGFTLGSQAGTLWGERHWQEKHYLYWEKALEQYEKEMPIYKRHHLKLESKEYQVRFMNGFHLGFQEAYIKAFQGHRVVQGEQNTNYYWINQKEEKILLEETNIHLQKGTVVEEIRPTVQLFIPANAFEGKFYLAVSEDTDSLYTKYATHRSISDLVYIRIPNQEKEIQNKKPLQLSFPWYGEDRAGIYEWINHQWRYVDSIIKEESINAFIHIRENNEGRYMVMVDETYQEISDLYGHWAQKELYAFLRRGYIQGNQEGLYHPEAVMTRGEFLLLVGKMQQWPLYLENTYPLAYLDKDTFGQYASVIQYATSQGYVSGYGDQTFRANQPITYQEVEWILQKVLKKPTFTWGWIEEELRYEKFILSKSRFGKNTPLPKSEIIFALYVLQEEGTIP